MLKDSLLFGRSADSFTLQWHLTNACELKCTHCYDCSGRNVLRLEEGRQVLSQLADFCADRKVHGKVSFTGGNPWLHPDFLALYRLAAGAGFSLSVLANPVEEPRLTGLLAVRKPAYYQVSLEGLEEHNDSVRGRGHFATTLRFLDTLQRHRVRAHVMLTLTQANVGQVLPLAELLQDRVHKFSWTRLAAMGEGAALEQVEPATFQRFLAEYDARARKSRMLGTKEGLLNVLREADGAEHCSGCTGHGCGAAFNFVALLPDGEVHACRKFPSLLGNVRAGGAAGDAASPSLSVLYDGLAARRYRKGSSACSRCALKADCGGCMAVAAGQGLDPLTALDPYCFRPRATSSAASL